MKVCYAAFGQDLFRCGKTVGTLGQPVPDSAHGHNGGHAVMDGPDGAICVPGDDDARAGG